MGFKPLRERGIPLEKQFRNWSEPNVKPYDKNNVDPYAQCRVITLNGAEAEATIFSHQFARYKTDIVIKQNRERAVRKYRVEPLGENSLPSAQQAAESGWLLLASPRGYNRQATPDGMKQREWEGVIVQEPVAVAAARA